MTAGLVWSENLIHVEQGGVARVTVMPGAEVRSVSGRFNGRTIPYFEREPGEYIAIIGIDMDLVPGILPFVSTWEKAGKTVEQTEQIEVRAAKFGLQELTLPKNKVDLDPPTLLRVNLEKGLMDAAFVESLGERLWKGAFIAPVEGKPQHTFGRRRLINGKPKRAHTGEDISAPVGTPILATNHGKVVLVADFFFNGRSVVIDHGLGLFSMYFHLSEVDVIEGQEVSGGKQIGRVGESGRVTGPHLHWGMRLNNATVNPYVFVETRFD